MSSFFTLPASQRKRKRSQNQEQTSRSRKRNDEDDSVSESDLSSGEERNATTRAGDDVASSEDDDEDFQNEDPAAKRVRLAEQYLANTRQEAFDEAGFDAAEVDLENLRQRMGDRLKEDTAERRGRIYRFLAEEMDWAAASRADFRTDMKSVTGIAIAAGFVYTVSKDMSLVKWALRSSGDASRKPRKALFRRGNQSASEHHQAPILCVAASADGKFVATGGADNRLIIWSASDLKPLKIFTGQHRDNGHRDSVLALAFRKDSNQLFSAGKDRTVKIWSCDELAYVETLFGHQDEVLDVDALGQEICVSVGARDRTARFWRVVEETQLVFRGGGGAGRGRPARFPKPEDNPNVKSTLDQSENEGSIDRIAFVDDDTFVTGSDNGTLSLWNIHKKKAIFTFPLAHGSEPPPPFEERSAEQDSTNQYLDAELLGNVRSQPRWITALKCLPFSNVLISGSWDGWLRAFSISADRRRIESIGIIGENAVTKLGGIVNDLAIAERGERGKEGLLIAAAVGTEHRLGRWKVLGGKHIGCIFEVSRKPKVNGIVDGASVPDRANDTEGSA